jgi:hypothetical protein
MRTGDQAGPVGYGGRTSTNRLSRRHAWKSVFGLRDPSSFLAPHGVSCSSCGLSICKSATGFGFEFDRYTELEKQGIGVKSLQEAIDTTTSGGRLFFHFFGALAEFERNLIQERTQAGLKAAKVRPRREGDWAAGPKHLMRKK